MNRMVNKLEDMKLCLGEGIKRTINGKEFEFFANDSDSLPVMMQLQQAVKVATDNISDMKKRQNAVAEVMAKPENSKMLLGMIDDMVKMSFPEAEDLIRKRFVMKNFKVLEEVFTELNMQQEDGKPDTDSKKA